MKKVFTLVAIFFISLNQTEAQALQDAIRINEIATGNRTNEHFIELYNLGTSFSEYKIISRWKNNNGTVGFYVLTFNGISSTASGYYVAGGSGASISANRNVTFSTENLVKYEANGTRSTSQDFDIFGASSLYVFLVKGTKIVDIFVAGQGSNAVDAQTEINQWPEFLGIDFKSKKVNNYNNCPFTAGASSSYSLMYNPSQTCTGSSLWVKASNITQKSVNIDNGTTSSAPTYPVWETTFKVYTSSRSLSDVQVLNSAQIPADSYTVLEESSGKKSIAFQYFISNSNLSVVDETNPKLTLFYDKGGVSGNPDGSYTTIVDPEITSTENKLSVKKEASINGFTVSFELSTDMLYINGGGDQVARPFFIMLTSGNGCSQQISYMIPNKFALLPVTLGAIRIAQKKENNYLTWSTLTEQNNKGFEVQRSIGNTNDFKTIGFVGTRAKDGNSQTEINYSFEDTDVKPGQTHFYRLNQIDFDGKSAFSPVKSIKPGSIESNLNVYPNPSQGSFTVNTGSTSGKLNIFVMDNTGRVVNQYMNVSTTNTKISNLKKGFYTLKIVNTESGEQSAQRVVVQ